MNLISSQNKLDQVFILAGSWIHLTRSNGYRELGMFDDSVIELEAIEFGEDRWHPSVVEARYKTYHDSKKELAMTMVKVQANGMPGKLEWLKNQTDAMTEYGDTAGLL